MPGTEQVCTQTLAQARRRRRRVTLVIRAFVNEDGEHYGVVSDPGETAGWEATFSEMAELVTLVQTRLDRGAIAEDVRPQHDLPADHPPEDDPPA
ncbi:MAG: hypothetical protein WDZ49_02630 [Litorilinea sp.]